MLYANELRDILIELDDICPVTEPVGVTENLVPLFKKHTRFKTIEFYPIVSDAVEGMHLSNSTRGYAALFPHKCEAHEAIVGACPDCQLHRLSCAKELIHTVDPEDHRTAPNQLEENIVVHLLKHAFDANAQVRADGMALPWAIELLMPYRHRSVMLGGMHVARARANDDYSFIATNYGVPGWAVRIAFSEGYMSSMRAIRETVGLPV